MELKVGVYRMEVRSEDTMPGADWEHPVYGATSDFTITKAQTTSPEEVVCTLQNIKVSVEYSPELADMLADTSKATVSLGDTSLDFSKTETRAAYFKPLALENTLNFAFDGTFADTGVPAKFSKQITGVKAGQWRKVSVVIGYADKGNILFSVKVDNSILQDNKFVVDGTENLGEELLEDPNAPALTWPGHDMTQPFTLTDAMFDAEGNCIEPFAFDLSSPNGIESLQVTVGSTNSQFLASMSAIQLPQTFDLCALDASSAAGIILKGFGYPVGSELKGQTAKSFNIAGQIRALYEFDGTHTFAFTMTDAKGVSSEAVLTLVVDKSSGQTGPRDHVARLRHRPAIRSAEGHGDRHRHRGRQRHQVVLRDDRLRNAEAAAAGDQPAGEIRHLRHPRRTGRSPARRIRVPDQRAGKEPNVGDLLDHQIRRDTAGNPGRA